MEFNYEEATRHGCLMDSDGNCGGRGLYRDRPLELLKYGLMFLIVAGPLLAAWWQGVSPNRWKLDANYTAMYVTGVCGLTWGVYQLGKLRSGGK